MDTQKLIFLGSQILAEETSFLFQQKLTSLKDQYTLSKTDSTAGPQIEESLKSISSSGLLSQTNELAPSFIKIQSGINGNKYCGGGIINSVEEITRANQFNIDNIVAQLNQFITDRQEFLTRITTLQNTLLQLNIIYEPNKELYELGILIPNKNDLTTIPKVEKHIHNWNIFLKQLSELTGQGAEDVKIDKVSNGSIELYIKQGLEIIECIATIMAKVGVIYLTINEIKKHREALKKLKAPAAEMKDIEKHEKSIIEEEITKTTEEIISKHEKTIPEGRKDELTAAVNKGMRFIARAIDNGIEVEIIPPTYDIPEQKREDDDEETVKKKDEKTKQFEIHKERAQIIKKTADSLKGIAGLGDTAFKMLTGGDEELDKEK